MLPKLSIKALIAAAFAVILLMALAATASLLITDRITRDTVARHEQAMKEAAGAKLSPAVEATYRELKDDLALSSRVTLMVRITTFLIGLVLAVVVYRRVAEMVTTTEEFAGRIERGDFAARFATGAGGEAAALAGALNRMVDSLDASIEKEAATSRRLSFLVAATPVAIYAAKADGGGVTYISPNISRLLGWTPQDFIGNPGFWRQNLHADDRARVLAHLGDLAGAGRIESEYRFRHQDGSWRWMRDEAELVRDASGTPQEMIGSWSDITRRKELEASARRRDAILNAVAYGSARFLRAGEETVAAQWRLSVEATLSHLGEATGVSRIWVVENTHAADGDLVARVIQHWTQPDFAVAEDDPLLSATISWHGNGMEVEALRLRRGEILQLEPDSLPPAPRERFQRLGIRSQLRAPIMMGDDWWGFIAFDDCIGDRQWAETELEALRAAASLFGGALAARAGRESLRASMETLGSALEKLRRQSAEIERQNTELARANRMKSEFLAAVTHELKTPLTGILGFADLLDAGLAGALAPAQQAPVREILGAAQQLHALVNRLLDLARIDAGKHPCAPQPTGIDALLRDAAQRHATAAGAHGLRIKVDADEALTARLDASLMHRLLDELIGNAIKFSREGGAITLRATLPPGAGPSIEVADEGIGIAAEELPRLFEPFVQIDGALHRQYGGAGLGLALARRIAELHGGEISVASTPDAGSRFTLRLPQSVLAEGGRAVQS